MNSGNMNSAPGTALVTGAAGHLGSRIARSLAERSMAVALNDVEESSVVKLARSISGAASFAADVSDHAAAARLAQDVLNRFATIDVLVNAAGIEGRIAAIEDLSPAMVRRVFGVNVLSMFWLCGSVVPMMKRRGGGRIVNLASGAGLAGGALASAYHASKHAVVGLTRSLARELGPHQIAVNAVCPGYVDSPMAERILNGEKAAAGRRPDPVGQIPMGRMAEPEEVAATVAYLALDAPLYMTGAAIVLDGGLRA